MVFPECERFPVYRCQLLITNRCFILVNSILNFVQCILEGTNTIACVSGCAYLVFTHECQISSGQYFCWIDSRVIFIHYFIKELICVCKCFTSIFSLFENTPLWTFITCLTFWGNILVCTFHNIRTKQVHCRCIVCFAANRQLNNINKSLQRWQC